jgi:hypothetical protein
MGNWFNWEDGGGLSSTPTIVLVVRLSSTGNIVSLATKLFNFVFLTIACAWKHRRAVDRYGIFLYI